MPLISLGPQELWGPGMTQAEGAEGGPAPRPGGASAKAPVPCCARLHGALAGWGLRRPCRDGTSAGLERRTGPAKTGDRGSCPRGLSKVNRYSVQDVLSGRGL